VLVGFWHKLLLLAPIMADTLIDPFGPAGA
jgi:hypothetical protein